MNSQEKEKTNPTKISKLKQFFVFSFISFLLVSYGCQMGEKRKSWTDPKPPKGFKKPKLQQLTSNGLSYHASFSPDGQQIVFISEDRLHHRQPQIYSLQLDSKNERRITFQYGEIYDVTFSSNGSRILYSSSTDELKENPPFIEDALSQLNGKKVSKTKHFNLLKRELPPTEIYRSSLDGHNIERLTHDRGFDGEISPHPRRNEIAFVSVGEKGPSLAILNTSSGGITRVKTQEEGQFFPQYSPDGRQLVWVTSLPNGTSHLYIGNAYGNNAKALVTYEGLHVHPSWSPDGNEIVFSSNYENENNFEIYSIKNDGSCLRRLTYLGSNEHYPRLSPDGTKLLFTSDRSGSPQVWISDLPKTEPCAPETSESKI